MFFNFVKHYDTLILVFFMNDLTSYCFTFSPVKTTK